MGKGGVKARRRRMIQHCVTFCTAAAHVRSRAWFRGEVLRSLQSRYAIDSETGRRHTRPISHGDAPAACTTLMACRARRRAWPQCGDVIGPALSSFKLLTSRSPLGYKPCVRRQLDSQRHLHTAYLHRVSACSCAIAGPARAVFKLQCQRLPSARLMLASMILALTNDPWADRWWYHHCRDSELSESA